MKTSLEKLLHNYKYFPDELNLAIKEGNYFGGEKSFVKDKNDFYSLYLLRKNIKEKKEKKNLPVFDFFLKNIKEFNENELRVFGLTVSKYQIIVITNIDISILIGTLYKEELGPPPNGLES